MYLIVPLPNRYDSPCIGAIPKSHMRARRSESILGLMSRRTMALECRYVSAATSLVKTGYSCQWLQTGLFGHKVMHSRQFVAGSAGVREASQVHTNCSDNVRMLNLNVRRCLHVAACGISSD
jgi:hypothetical protein